MAVRPSYRGPRRHGGGGFGAVRSTVLALAHAITMGASSVAARPVSLNVDALGHGGGESGPEEEAGLVMLYVVSMVLVLLGGAFAGLTIALMGQDSIYLQVLAGDPNEAQSKNARRVYRLLKRGKHWVLVTLLLSNVIVNETLPVVLDRCFGGGVAAVVGSTILIVIFGEVVPQSVCVRYGLPIGGYMAGPVLFLMYLMAPIAWPIAKLLDFILGEDHGTVYKKSGLKTLVGLHQSLGDAAERLNEDEVTIISAVLDLKSKRVGNVMTPMDDVFTVSEDTVLDERTMEKISSEGYSRIPVHAAGQPTNFVGMLLVKILITYDPEDAKLVKDFPLATLPETRPETSCLDIINFFQEGKSHMVLVSETPGEDRGCLGIVCLEDVIEELIGEEIIDESDVYIDVHKAIRRLTPAPKARPVKKEAVTSLTVVDVFQNDARDRTGSVASDVLSSSPRATTFLLRRPSGGPDGPVAVTAVPLKANFDEVRESLRHLGPSNPATNPRNTRSTAVKIKPGTAAPSTLGIAHANALTRTRSSSSDTATAAISAAYDGPDDSEHAPLLKPPLTGKNGVHALRKSYGMTGRSPTQQRLSGQSPHPEDDKTNDTHHDVDEASSSTIRPLTRSTVVDQPASKPASATLSGGSQSSHAASRTSSPTPQIGNLIGRNSGLTEDLVEHGGVQKIIIRTTTSSGSSTHEDPQPPLPSRPRTWSLRDRFGGGGRQSGGESESGESGQSRDDKGKYAQEIDPLVVVPDTSSPVEVPLAQAIVEPIGGGEGKSGGVRLAQQLSKEVDGQTGRGEHARSQGPRVPFQSQEPSQEPSQVSQEPQSQITQEPPSQITQEPPSQITQEPPSQITQEPPSQIAQEPPSQISQEPSQISQEPSQISPPPKDTPEDPDRPAPRIYRHTVPAHLPLELRQDSRASQSSASDAGSTTNNNSGVKSPLTDPRSPLTSNLALDEDLAASTASLGSSQGGSQAGSKRKKKKGKKKGRGTAF